jgi:hypothetical protein
MFEDELLAADSRSAELLEMATVRRLWSEHRAGEREHGFRLWTLLTLERWLRSLGRSPELQPPTHDSVEAAEAVGA